MDKANWIFIVWIFNKLLESHNKQLLYVYNSVERVMFDEGTEFESQANTFDLNIIIFTIRYQTAFFSVPRDVSNMSAIFLIGITFCTSCCDGKAHSVENRCSRSIVWYERSQYGLIRCHSTCHFEINGWHSPRSLSSRWYKIYKIFATKNHPVSSYYIVSDVVDLTSDMS